MNFASIGINTAAVAGAAAIATITGLVKGSGSEALNDFLQVLSQPTLCYVPIACDSIEENCEADVANTMIIAQTTGLKGYITDNVAPKPRTWSIHGYITALVPLLEDYLLIKPTLLVQRALLDAAFQSRNTVPFKTDTGEIVDVVITRKSIKSMPNAQNAYEVNITVQEVEVLDTSTTGNILNLSSIAKKSVALRTVTNLGSASVVGGTVSAVSLVAKLVR